MRTTVRHPGGMVVPRGEEANALGPRTGVVVTHVTGVLARILGTARDEIAVPAQEIEMVRILGIMRVERAGPALETGRVIEMTHVQYTEKTETVNDTLEAVRPGKLTLCTLSNDYMVVKRTLAFVGFLRLMALR